jgi:hypothetical protein
MTIAATSRLHLSYPQSGSSGLVGSGTRTCAIARHLEETTAIRLRQDRRIAHARVQLPGIAPHLGRPLLTALQLGWTRPAWGRDPVVYSYVPPAHSNVLRVWVSNGCEKSPCCPGNHRCLLKSRGNEGNVASPGDTDSQPS